MKKSKSLNIIKMVKEGLNQFAKALKIKPHLLYIILGLLSVILISLGLGTQRDGFKSFNEAPQEVTQLFDNVNGYINQLSWSNNAEKTTFITNINDWFLKQMNYYANQDGIDLKTIDKNKNNKIYKLTLSKGAKDSSGNILPKYIDDMQPTAPNNYILTDIENSITNAQLNSLRTTIMNKINNFSTSNPSVQPRLQTAFDELQKYCDQLGALFISGNVNPSGMNFTNVLSQVTRQYSNNASGKGSIGAGSSGAGASGEGASGAGASGAGRIGTTKSDIPPGTEDLYVLKSQYPPPSNPPGGSNQPGGSNDSNKKTNQGFGLGTSPDLDAYNKVNPSPTQNTCKPAVVPPCPPCERCPEPSFDCKRVPNYNSAAINQYLPQPVLADFSQFGM